MGIKVKITLEPRDVYNDENLDGTNTGSHVEFYVVQLINTVDYDLGQRLRRDEVQGLCDLERWTVIIKKT